MIHDQETRSDTYNFVSEPQLIDLRLLRENICFDKQIIKILEFELSDELFNIKIDLKSKGVYNIEITISGWFETYETEQSKIDYLEDQINDIIASKIEK